MKQFAALGLLLCILASPIIQSGTGSTAGQSGTTITEIRRFAAPEARQAVAVDAEFIYAISNSAVTKYDKKAGKKIAGWECPEGKPLIHLNSGVVRDGELYCAHSNYPGVPMTGSIEIWDTNSLKHIGSHSFGISTGSTTWIDFYKGFWYVCFAHYGNKAAEPNRDSSWTNVVKYDQSWNRLESWVFPAEVIKKFGTYSSSGGIILDDGTLYVTGHDAPEIYALKFPEGGSTLELVETISVNFPGQGIAWDRSSPGTLWSIFKANREVMVSRVERR